MGEDSQAAEHDLLDGAATVGVVDGGGVRFAHVLTPDGRVIGRYTASLDRRYDDTEYLCGDLSGPVDPRLSVCLQPLTSGVLFAGLVNVLRHGLWNQKPLGAVSKEMGIAGLGQQNDWRRIHDSLPTHRFSPDSSEPPVPRRASCTSRSS